MVTGILCGFGAALLNSIGFLFSARFIKKYKSSFALLIYAQIWMLILSLPILLLLFPSLSVPQSGIAEMRPFLTALLCWLIVFFTGQGSLFAGQRYLEASKISSLLGLKIIVLTLICIAAQHKIPHLLQWIAILMAAVAGILIHWNGSFSISGRGMLFVCITLIGFSLSDINETKMVLCFVRSGFPTFKSAVLATVAGYTALGICSLPGLFFIKPDKKQFLNCFPYAFLWLLSQILLFACFSRLLPVFGNVLLAFRGVFSVILGAMLAWLGIQNRDADITKKQWLVRGFAAFLMILAIGLYSGTALIIKNL